MKLKEYIFRSIAVFLFILAGLVYIIMTEDDDSTIILDTRPERVDQSTRNNGENKREPYDNADQSERMKLSPIVYEDPVRTDDKVSDRLVESEFYNRTVGPEETDFNNRMVVQGETEYDNLSVSQGETEYDNLSVGPEKTEYDNLSIEQGKTEHDKLSVRQGGQNSENGTEGLTDINLADTAELMLLPGIGQVKADAIINYRNENGSFASIEELMNVPGIKEATFNKIKDMICVNIEGS